MKRKLELDLKILGLDHVQLAMPAGQEHAARHFYVGFLGLIEVQKPSHLAARGGAWFENAGVKIHLGVDPDFRPARKAHPGLLVSNLQDLIEALRSAGHEIVDGEPLDGYEHAYVDDPFGNRLELMERTGGGTKPEATPRDLGTSVGLLLAVDPGTGAAEEE